MRLEIRRWNGALKAVVLAAAMLTSTARAARSSDARRDATEWARYYASRLGVPEDLVDAVIQVESGWDPYALSEKGAAGLMQLMPDTAARFGVADRFNIEENIRGGVTYLARLIHLFDGDLRLVLAAYQVGEAPILSRRLAYSSPDVFLYVQRVAVVDRILLGRRGRKVLPGGGGS
jgi:soluble lytic murein transglycosylase-like protein